MNSWHSYPSVYNLGHRYVADIFAEPVLIEEKVDGSQFSFGVFENPEGERFIRCRSKGAELNLIAPEGMFVKAVEVVRELEPLLKVGCTYRAEYLVKPKHNALNYSRVPNKHLIIFDINPAEETYLSYAEKKAEAERLGLEIVPLVFEGKVDSLEVFRSFLEAESILGGQKIEGVVVKNYSRFGLDKKVLMGKFVSESFRETHKKEWMESNPTGKDVVNKIIETYKTPARWNKAIIHLKERGLLEESPRDIGHLMKEVPEDIKKDSEEEIKEVLFKHYWPQIRRGVIGGLPEWYKEELLKKQFSTEGQAERVK